MKIEKEILYRYFNGDATPEEEHKIRQYLEASDENWKEYLRERKFFDTIILKEQVVSEEKQMKRRQLIRKISLECLKVAAVLLIAFGTAFFWNNQSEKPATKSVVNTLKGQMANITLPGCGLTRIRELSIRSILMIKGKCRLTERLISKSYGIPEDLLLFILRMTNR